MGYKCAKKIMKKFLFMLVMMCCTLFAMAEEKTTSCKVGNSDTEYVSATAYVVSGGVGKCNSYITIANSSNKPLVSLYITVTAEKATQVDNGKYTWEEVTLYSGNKYFSPAVNPNMTTRLDAKSFNSARSLVRNINISIGNPSCK